MTKTKWKSIMPLAFMSRPGTERLLFPIEASKASDPVRRSRVDTNSGYAQKIFRLLYTQYSSTVSAHDVIEILTIRPWMSFDALLEEPLNIWLWARADPDYRWSLWRRKHGVSHGNGCTKKQKNKNWFRKLEGIVQRSLQLLLFLPVSAGWSYWKQWILPYWSEANEFLSCVMTKVFLHDGDNFFFFLFHFTSTQNQFLQHLRLFNFFFLCECDLVIH